MQLALFSADRLPYKPKCVNEYGEGIKHNIRSVDHALRHRHIQPNTKTLIWRLVFDIDRPCAAYAWEDKNLPPFNWAATNPKNGHAHVAYELEIPVSLLDKTTKAARLLLAVKHELAMRLGADMAFAGNICKNPIHSAWHTIEFRKESYSLSELADWVDLKGKTAKKEINTDIESYLVGRNATLFDHLRFWAYRAVREFWAPGARAREQWLRAVEQQAEMIWEADEINWSTANQPFTEAERRQIAKSVGVYTWEHFTPRSFAAFVARTHTSEKQRTRGAKGGKKSGDARKAAIAPKIQEAIEMRNAGMTQRGIAEKIGVSVGTINGWLKCSTKPISETPSGSTEIISVKEVVSLRNIPAKTNRTLAQEGFLPRSATLTLIKTTSIADIQNSNKSDKSLTHDGSVSCSM